MLHSLSLGVFLNSFKLINIDLINQTVNKGIKSHSKFNSGSNLESLIKIYSLKKWILKQNVIPRMRSNWS